MSLLDLKLLAMITLLLKMTLRGTFRKVYEEVTSCFIKAAKVTQHSIRSGFFKLDSIILLFHIKTQCQLIKIDPVY